MFHALRLAILSFALTGFSILAATAQTAPLVFTPAAADRAVSRDQTEISTVIEDRGLSLWTGATSDFGVGITLSNGNWDVRSITSMTTLQVGARDRHTFQQIEIERPLFSMGSFLIAAGGGVRQQWDGTQVLLGRVLSGVDVGRGRLLGDVLIARSGGQPAVRHDAADVVASVGWSQHVGGHASLGIEGIGRDLEGFWNADEADGGAILLLGPSIHVRSAGRGLTASLTAGPVVQTLSRAVPTSQATRSPSVLHHFGLFASATWVPSFAR